MSDLFDAEDEVIEPIDDFDEVDVDITLPKDKETGIDARRRLENRLDDKRLHDELEDFLDY
jgi:hypothetical protein